MPRPLRVFISYCEKDEAHRKRLETHLTLLKRQGLIEPWTNQMILAGTQIDTDPNLANADIILLLISADFVASDYYDKELQPAMERHRARTARVIPIIVEPGSYEGEFFEKLQSLPRSGRPISTSPHRDEAWLEVAKSIRAVVESMGARPLPDPSPLPVAPKPGGKLKILFLGATPDDAVQLQLGREIKEIRKALRESGAEQHFELVTELAVRVDELHTLLMRHSPAIVHFSGHGNSAGELILEDRMGVSQTVPVTALAGTFRILKQGIRCVMLNACFSQTQADAIRQHIDCVIGMGNAIDDRSAAAFASSFYLALGFGKSVATAFELGSNEVAIQTLPHHDIPKLLCRAGVDPATVVLTG